MHTKFNCKAAEVPLMFTRIIDWDDELEKKHDVPNNSHDRFAAIKNNDFWFLKQTRQISKKKPPLTPISPIAIESTDMKNITDYRRGNCSQTTGEQLAPSVPSHDLARPAFSLFEGAWGERSRGRT